jgi:hypothetical protein
VPPPRLNVSRPSGPPGGEPPVRRRRLRGGAGALRERLREGAELEAVLQSRAGPSASGRTVEALDFYERYLAETANASAKLRIEAQQRIGDLVKSVAAIEIRSEAAGHEVNVDGHSYGMTPLHRPVRVLPGPHQIVVVQSDASGATPFVEKVMARAGERITVDVHVRTPVAGPDREVMQEWL